MSGGVNGREGDSASRAEWAGTGVIRNVDGDRHGEVGLVEETWLGMSERDGWA